MKKLNLLYTGKAKKVYATENSDYCIFEYKDAATAFNGQKVGFFDGKGMINNKMANAIFKLLEKDGIKTHFVEELSDRESLVKRVEIIPLEVIIRNISAGSFCKRYGVEEGEVFDKPTIEFSYKNDALGDPLINSYHAYALKIATEEDVLEIKRMAFAVNESILNLSSEKRKTVKSCWLTRFLRTHAGFGTLRQIKSWIRTGLDLTWESSATFILRFGTGLKSVTGKLYDINFTQTP